MYADFLSALKTAYRSARSSGDRRVMDALALAISYVVSGERDQAADIVRGLGLIA
jgi:hypothetical protein